MNFQSLLNEVLKIAQQKTGHGDIIYDKKHKHDKPFKYDKKYDKKFDKKYDKSNSYSTASKIAGGGAAAGVLAAMLGGKKKSGSSTAGTLLKVGSIAALGALAYHAYSRYSEQKPNTTPPPQDAFSHDGQINENAGKAILRAMIAAAASDGDIDAQERAMIVGESGLDAGMGLWLEQEFARPATPIQIAQDVGNNPALAAEVYLAARMLCDELSRKEIVFLAQLAQALQLDNQLVEQLEKQAGF